MPLPSIQSDGPNHGKNLPVMACRNPPRRYLRGILAVAILLRVLVVGFILHSLGPQGVFSPDTPGYVAPIHNMLHGSFATQDGPELKRTPGYPVFLMLTGMANDHPLLSVSAQVLLACFSVWLVYKIAILLFQDGAAAVLCAGLYAMEPISVFYSVLLFAEALFTAVLLVFLYQLAKYLRVPSWSSLLSAAVALCACVYIKPVAYYLPVFCAVGLAFLPASLALPRRLLRGVAFLAVCVVLIGAWQIRNYRETGYSGFTSISDTQLYTYNAAGVLAQKEHLDFFAERDKLDQASHPEQANWSLARKFAFQKHEALRIIEADPLIYAKLHLRGMATALLDPGGTDMLRHLGLYPTVGGLESMVVDRGIAKTMLWVLVHRPLVSFVTLAIGALTAVYYLLAIFGIPAVSRQREVFIALVLTAAYFIAVAGGPAGMGRYRYPIMPIVALFAGAGLARLLRLRRHAGAVNRISTGRGR